MVCVVSIRRGVLPSVSLRSVHAVLLVSCFWILWVSFWCESEVAQSYPILCHPWTVAHQAPPSMEFSRQDYWSVLPFPSPGDLPDPGIEPRSPTLLADALPSEPLGNP